MCKKEVFKAGLSAARIQTPATIVFTYLQSAPLTLLSFCASTSFVLFLFFTWAPLTLLSFCVSILCCIAFLYLGTAYTAQLLRQPPLFYSFSLPGHRLRCSAFAPASFVVNDIQQPPLFYSFSLPGHRLRCSAFAPASFVVYLFFTWAPLTLLLSFRVNLLLNRSKYMESRGLAAVGKVPPTAFPQLLRLCPAGPGLLSLLNDCGHGVQRKVDMRIKGS
jgi:hypothetical protein